MKNARMTILLVAVMLLAGQGFSAMYLQDGGTWDISTEIPTNEIVYVDLITSGNPTTVNILQGAKISSVRAYNTSRINLFGGIINDSLQAYDSSIVNVSGGIASGLEAHGSSVVNISDGSFGTFGARGGGTINISGGSFNTVGAYESSIVNIFGGTIYHIAANSMGGGIINMFGGSVTGPLQAHHLGTVIFYGYDFELGDGLSWDVDGRTILGTGVFTGKWFDDTSFIIDIDGNHDTATIMAIPEPMTFLLLGLGGVFIRRKR